MKKLLNTLFITRPGSYLHLDHDTVRLEVEGETIAQLPIIHFSSVVCMGDVMVSPAAMMRFAGEGRQLTFLDQFGRFRARVEGPISGNVLLRMAQYETVKDEGKCSDIANRMVTGKIINARNILLRAGRKSTSEKETKRLYNAVMFLKRSVLKLKHKTSLEVIRGIEGDASKIFFGVFDLMVREDRKNFSFGERSRRPPLNRTNALLSFLYALLMHDCIAAIEGVGLDSQVGYLHSIKPGRPSLALDLMEEFRPIVADRLTLTLINRKQIVADDFDERPGGAVYLSEEGRKKVIIAYQKRKHEEVSHQLFKQKVPLGLIPHIQARILTRYLRGEIEAYTPYIPK